MTIKYNIMSTVLKRMLYKHGEQRYLDVFEFDTNSDAIAFVDKATAIEPKPDLEDFSDFPNPELAYN